MSPYGLNGAEFHSLTGQILHTGHGVRFQARGGSMQPFIRDGDILEVVPLSGLQIRCGDVLLVETVQNCLLAHRIVKIGYSKGAQIYLIKGDACPSPDGWFRSENVLGRIEVVEHNGRAINLSSDSQHWKALMLVRVAPWVSRFSWLPVKFRQYVWNWLFGSLILE